MFEPVDKDTLVVRNVKACDFCGGPVDRFCHNLPDPHFILSTKYFECRICGALGDANTGIMVDLCKPQV